MKLLKWRKRLAILGDKVVKSSVQDLGVLGKSADLTTVLSDPIQRQPQELRKGVRFHLLTSQVEGVRSRHQLCLLPPLF